MRIRVLFVCHGNICRSPMAEFVFKDLALKKGVADMFSVASSATSTEEIWNGIGNPVYPPAARELAKHGISCGGKRAVQLKADDYDKYDFFVCMDSNNMRNIKRIFKSDPCDKISKLLDHTSFAGDVANPWYSGDFDTAYNDIFRGCTALLDELLD